MGGGFPSAPSCLRVPGFRLGVTWCIRVVSGRTCEIGPEAMVAPSVTPGLGFPPVPSCRTSCTSPPNHGKI
jgi:hypothetical protein